jgi:hypothetical protein
MNSALRTIGNLLDNLTGGYVRAGQQWDAYNARRDLALQRQQDLTKAISDMNPTPQERALALTGPEGIAAVVKARQDQAAKDAEVKRSSQDRGEWLQYGERLDLPYAERVAMAADPKKWAESRAKRLEPTTASPGSVVFMDGAPIGSAPVEMEPDRELRDPITGRLIAKTAPKVEHFLKGRDQSLIEVGGPQVAQSDPSVSTPSAGASAPRGIRNNNPLNLTSLPEGRWAGQTGDDGRYAVFNTPEAGFAAADKNLQAYGSRHGINTISGVISRWAPSSENDTGAYINTVARELGIDPNAKIDLGDAGLRQRLLTSMAKVENGQPVHLPAAPASPGTAPAPAGGGPRVIAPADANTLEWQDLPGGGQVNTRTGQKRGTPEVKTLESDKAGVMFLKRALDANDRLNAVAERGILKPSAWKLVSEKNGVSRLVLSRPEDRQFVQAAKEWLAPVLRKDTGAAVTDSEFIYYTQIFIPSPEDDPQTLAQKAQARHDYMATQAGIYGPLYDKTYGKRSFHVVYPKAGQPEPQGGQPPAARVRRFNPLTGRLE